MKLWSTLLHDSEMQTVEGLDRHLVSCAVQLFVGGAGPHTTGP